jgi:hypothetical protein
METASFGKYFRRHFRQIPWLSSFGSSLHPICAWHQLQILTMVDLHLIAHLRSELDRKIVVISVVDLILTREIQTATMPTWDMTICVAKTRPKIKHHSVSDQPCKPLSVLSAPGAHLFNPPISSWIMHYEKVLRNRHTDTEDGQFCDRPRGQGRTTKR